MTGVQVISTQSLAAVEAHLSQVIDEVAGTHERVTITKNGSPVAVVLESQVRAALAARRR